MAKHATGTDSITKNEEKQSKSPTSYSDRAALVRRLSADSKRERKIQFDRFSPVFNQAEEPEDIMIIFCTL